jgi:hypothetical protein
MKRTKSVVVVVAVVVVLITPQMGVVGVLITPLGVVAMMVHF